MDDDLNKKVKGTVVVAIALALLSANALFSQEGGFSKTELQKIRKLGSKSGCANFEATYSAPLTEKPTAMLDLEKSHLIQGVFSRVLDVVAVNPTTYQMKVTDPEACETLKGQQVSITITDGKGSDGKTLFPAERSLSLR
jgi:hypothetical protein